VFLTRSARLHRLRGPPADEPLQVAPVLPELEQRDEGAAEQLAAAPQPDVTERDVRADGGDLGHPDLCFLGH